MIIFFFLRIIYNGTARYKSVIVLQYPNGVYLYGEGECEGYILDHYQGNGGFGYDPLFYSKDLNKTFAEITLDEKNTVSHRAKAIKNLIEKL